MRPAQKPLLVILTRNKSNNYYGVLLSPKNNNEFKTIKANGVNEIIGILKDKGYEFSKLNDKIPKWVFDKIPSYYYIVSKADIISFPINI